jgi:hypothetical protein
MREVAGFGNKVKCLAGSILALGLGLAGCSDDPAGATADGVSWRVSLTTGSGLAPTNLHDVNDVDPQPYKVSCSNDGVLGYTIVITDPGRAALTTATVNGQNTNIDQRTSSKLTLRNTGTVCTVKVEEGPVGSAQIEYNDSCSNGGGGGCTLNVLPASGGYDFVGTLICNKVTNGSAGNTFLLSADGNAQSNIPIKLNIDNCD